MKENKRMKNTGRMVVSHRFEQLSNRGEQSASGRRGGPCSGGIKTGSRTAARKPRGLSGANAFRANICLSFTIVNSSAPRTHIPVPTDCCMDESLLPGISYFFILSADSFRGCVRYTSATDQQRSTGTNRSARLERERQCFSQSTWPCFIIEGRIKWTRSA